MMIQIQLFLLLLMRVGSFIMICPGFSLKGMPQLLKIALSFGLTLPLYQMVSGLEVELSVSLFAWMALKEVFLGLAIGYVSLLFFSAVEMAGAFADVQAGFSMAQIFDPSIGLHASYLGRIYYWVSLTIYFIGDFHHLMLASLAYSFDVLPVFSTSIQLDVSGILTVFTSVFEIALNLAAPLIIVALLTEILLGILSRTVPQINVLILSMPLKVLVVVFFLLAFLPTLFRTISMVMPDMIRYTNEFIYSLGD
ncbi:flagellar biosynthetic protein FliR [Jeotgalibaca dankookensis]|uniref:flagellar biosynthetic protein FliR n=1 Tax=Jeotgalibaca dankookensis TaxID=708126 RepID=UPI000A708074|nr:flagellar biosynthetic protein FliR [Jeotgalibaca dankookensis]